MAFLERVQSIEEAQRREDDGRAARGMEALRAAVGEIVPLDRVAVIVGESPERARNEIRDRKSVV